MRILAVLTTLILSAFVACGGSSSSMPDAAGSGSGSGSGSACTGMLYDSCNPAADNCMTPNVCKAYTSSGFSVCVPPQGQCTSGGCPNQGASAVACNGMGYCKPSAANTDCTSP